MLTNKPERQLLRQNDRLGKKKSRSLKPKLPKG